MPTRSARSLPRIACHPLWATLSLAAAWASAKNFLVDHKFSGGPIAPWADRSGSASGTYNVAAFGVALAMNQCSLVTAGDDYQFAGKVLIPFGQTTSDSTNVDAGWCTSSTCGGTLLTQENVSTEALSSASANGAWIATAGFADST